MQGAIDEALRRPYLDRDFLGSGMQLDVLVHRGAGAYICGEETGLMEFGWEEQARLPAYQTAIPREYWGVWHAYGGQQHRNARRCAPHC